MNKEHFSNMWKMEELLTCYIMSACRCSLAIRIAKNADFWKLGVWAKETPSLGQGNWAISDSHHFLGLKQIDSLIDSFANLGSCAREAKLSCCNRRNLVLWQRKFFTNDLLDGIHDFYDRNFCNISRRWCSIAFEAVGTFLVEPKTINAINRQRVLIQTRQAKRYCSLDIGSCMAKSQSLCQSLTKIILRDRLLSFQDLLDDSDILLVIGIMGLWLRRLKYCNMM